MPIFSKSLGGRFNPGDFGYVLSLSCHMNDNFLWLLYISLFIYSTTLLFNSVQLSYSKRLSSGIAPEYELDVSLLSCMTLHLLYQVILNGILHTFLSTVTHIQFLKALVHLDAQQVVLFLAFSVIPLFHTYFDY